MEDVASWLKYMQSSRPLLKGRHSHDMSRASEMMTEAGSASSTPMSAVVQPSPTANSTHDVGILNSSTMLNSYEHDMLLSSLGTSSNNDLSFSSDELSPRLEHSEKWSLASESNYPDWTLHQDFSVTGEHGNFLSKIIENAPKASHTIQPEANRVELTWCQETGEQTDTRMDDELPYHLRDAESRGFPYVHSPPTVNVHSSNDLLKLLDSSDQSDTAGDVDKIEKPSHEKSPTSKNLLSERRRRERLNERLYSLRAMVPKISKMSKASIVTDAISYIRDLQKQVEERETDIANLRYGADTFSGGIVDPKKPANKRSGTAVMNARRNQVLEKHRILEFEVSEMEEQSYHLRINCKKSPAVSVQLAKAMEALEFEFVNANLNSVNGHVLSNFVVKVKNGEVLKSAGLRKMALDVIPKFGLHL